MYISYTNILDYYYVINGLLTAKIEYYISISISWYMYLCQYLYSMDKYFIFHLKDIFIQKSGPSSS